LIPLPAKCLELNAQENVWQFMRDNWLSNRIFKSYNHIVDHACQAWNKLVESVAVGRPGGMVVGFGCTPIRSDAGGD
jgi:hypothetical protein